MDYKHLTDNEKEKMIVELLFGNKFKDISLDLPSRTLYFEEKDLEEIRKRLRELKIEFVIIEDDVMTLSRPDLVYYVNNHFSPKKERLNKIKLSLRNLSSVDYNKKLNEIGKSVRTEHIELERVLSNIINITHDIRFNTEREKETLKVLEDCKSKLSELKWN